MKYFIKKLDLIISFGKSNKKMYSLILGCCLIFNFMIIPIYADHLNTMPKTSQWLYEYDANGRLIKAFNPSKKIVYLYDYLGNIIYKDLESDKTPPILPDSHRDEHSSSSEKEEQNHNEKFDIKELGNKKPIDINKFSDRDSFEKEKEPVLKGEHSNISVYTDITGHWAQSDIEFVLKRGLFNGIKENEFAPNKTMNRAMLITVLARHANVDRAIYSSESFQDIKKGSYYYEYVKWAFESKMINGVSAQLFKPEQELTREQLITVLFRYIKINDIKIPLIFEEKDFIDEENISSWAREAFLFMQRCGVIKGDDKNRLNPKEKATRAEVASVLKRFIELMEN